MSSERPQYFDSYPTINFTRDDDGIVILTLHTDDGPVTYSSQHHRDWVGAFYDVGRDADNAVVIITGTGDSFIDAMAWDTPVNTPDLWEKIHHEGKRFLRNLLDIEVPVIAAINGPVSIHAEVPLLSDITIASTTATFSDAPHFPSGGVPGDGVHIVWPELLGSNRGRYFLLTGQVLTAEEAKSLGVINEVCPPAQLMPRALELARMLAAKPAVLRRHTRTVLTIKWKRLLDEGLGYGLALEGLNVISSMPATSL
jgi:enoyl-CoA hydratase/carnithine racemase